MLEEMVRREMQKRIRRCKKQIHLSVMIPINRHGPRSWQFGRVGRDLLFLEYGQPIRADALIQKDFNFGSPAPRHDDIQLSVMIPIHRTDKGAIGAVRDFDAGLKPSIAGIAKEEDIAVGV